MDDKDLEEELEDYAEDDDLEDPPLMSNRKRGASRIYFVIMSVTFAVLLLISVISLGAFAAKHAQIAESNSGRRVCVLFAEHRPPSPAELAVNGPCAFVLWGQVTMTLVFLVWLIYSIVLTIVGPKVVSMLRLLDLIMSVLSGLLSFGVSVALHAGLNQTCGAFDDNTGNECKDFHVPTKIGFYNEINVAKSTSWIISIMFIFLSLWYSLLLVIYCIRCGHKRAMEPPDYDFIGQEDFQDDDDDLLGQGNLSTS